MKKFLITALLVLLCFSSIVPSMAQTAHTNPNMRVGDVGSTAMRIVDDELIIYKTNGEDERIPFGKTFLYPLLTEGGVVDYNDDGEPIGHVDSNLLVYDNDYVDNIRIKTEWYEGEEYVQNVELIKRKVYETSFGNLAEEQERQVEVAHKNDAEDMYDVVDVFVANTNPEGAYYFIAVTTKENYSTTNIKDLIGEITLRNTHDEVGIVGEEIVIDVNIELEHINDGDMTIYKQETILEFEGDNTEEWITFESHSFDYFIVDTCDQKDLIAKVDSIFDTSVSSKFPEANLHFFNGNYVTFNRIGELTLTGGRTFENSEQKYIYAISQDGQISEVEDAIYDEHEDAFKIRTRTLGRYFISDIKLILEIPVVVTPTVPSLINPNTGAVV